MFTRAYALHNWQESRIMLYSFTNILNQFVEFERPLLTSNSSHFESFNNLGLFLKLGFGPSETYLEGDTFFYCDESPEGISELILGKEKKFGDYYFPYAVFNYGDFLSSNSPYSKACFFSKKGGYYNRFFHQVDFYHHFNLHSTGEIEELDYFDNTDYWPDYRISWDKIKKQLDDDNLSIVDIKKNNELRVNDINYSGFDCDYPDDFIAGFDIYDRVYIKCFNEMFEPYLKPFEIKKLRPLIISDKYHQPNANRGIFWADFSSLNRISQSELIRLSLHTGEMNEEEFDYFLVYFDYKVKKIDFDYSAFENKISNKYLKTYFPSKKIEIIKKFNSLINTCPNYSKLVSDCSFFSYKGNSTFSANKNISGNKIYKTSIDDFKKVNFYKKSINDSKVDKNLIVKTLDTLFSKNDILNKELKNSGYFFKSFGDAKKKYFDCIKKALAIQDNFINNKNAYYNGDFIIDIIGLRSKFKRDKFFYEKGIKFSNVKEL